jgi:hypothetical protein
VGKIFGGPPKPDTSAADAARAQAEAQAQAEKDALAKKQAEDEDALRRGLRGRRALLSDTGGELGFSSALGG